MKKSCFLLSVQFLMSSLGFCWEKQIAQSTINTVTQNQLEQKNDQNLQVMIDDFDNGIVSIGSNSKIFLDDDFLKIMCLI